MGPRLGRRGNIVTGALSNAGAAGFNGATPWEAWKRGADLSEAHLEDALQWGHALGGVETGVTSICGPSAGRCFNGATPWEAWKRAAGGRRRRGGSSFNGATPWEAWKLQLRRLSALLVTPASMGPRLGRRGNETADG